MLNGLKFQLNSNMHTNFGQETSLDGITSRNGLVNSDAPMV